MLVELSEIAEDKLLPFFEIINLFPSFKLKHLYGRIPRLIRLALEVRICRAFIKMSFEIPLDRNIIRITDLMLAIEIW